MDWTVGTYAAYLVIAVPLTIWVATTLSRNGRLFLEDVYAGNDGLAGAVNRLLVVGFYLLNLGFVSLYLRVGTDVVDLRGLVEQLSVKIGVVTVVLGVVHFVNVYVFNAIRRRHRMEELRRPPLEPQSYVAAPYPAGG
ncbi:hypothetical protein QWY28_02365 [Nocardioides sp. SOB77]|uniref:Integral membrane protein n=1 Tax=Nocardioides oceani TaxID=3058369 RepID=A0ABT8FC87_9ACTN|nr:hypothetical protein [Nocardioides oceani]MDN4171777.1 hypothetical protein [Nocardioides oceani]